MPISMHGETALILAAREGHTDIVVELIREGADINHKATGGYTALMWAAQWGKTEVVEALIDEGVEVDHENDNRETALSFAAQWGKTGVVEALLRAGANKGSAAQQARDRGHNTLAGFIEQYTPSPMVKPGRRSAAVEPSGPAASGTPPTGAAGKQEKE